MLQPFKIDFPDEFEMLTQSLQIKRMSALTSTNGSKIFEYVIIPRKKGPIQYLVFHLALF